MATNKKSTTSKGKLVGNVSWKSFFFAASVVLNIGFLVVLITMTTTNALDSMFMREGLRRYCDPVNDDKFLDNTEEAQALRLFTCARGDAQQEFNDAFNSYLHERDIDHNH